MPPSSPPSSPAPLPPFRLLPLTQNPPLIFRHMLSPGTPSRLFSTGLQHPLPFSTVRSDRTERRASVRSYLAELRASVRSCLALRSVLFDRTEDLHSAKYGRTKDLCSERPSLSPVWPNGAGREEGAGGRKELVPGVRGAPGESWWGEYVPGSEGRVLGKGGRERRGEGGGRCREGNDAREETGRRWSPGGHC